MIFIFIIIAIIISFEVSIIELWIWICWPFVCSRMILAYADRIKMFRAQLWKPEPFSVNDSMRSSSSVISSMKQSPVSCCVWSMILISETLLLSSVELEHVRFIMSHSALLLHVLHKCISCASSIFRQSRLRLSFFHLYCPLQHCNSSFSITLTKCFRFL